MAWYVVYRGRHLGVYASWAGCLEQVNGYPGSLYKSFPDKDEAVVAFLEFKGCTTEEVPVYLHPPTEAKKGKPPCFILAAVQSVALMVICMVYFTNICMCTLASVNHANDRQICVACGNLTVCVHCQ